MPAVSYIGTLDFSAAGSVIGCEDQGFAEGRGIAGNGAGCLRADDGNEVGVPMAVELDACRRVVLASPRNPGGTSTGGGTP